jgi:hypothetical protein
VNLSKKSVLICGLIRDGDDVLEKQIEMMDNAFRDFKNVGFIIIESDSRDATPEILSRISQRRSDFNYICLGKLESTIPNRIQRLRFCRNKYVEFIRNSNKKYDFIVVADLDGINSKLTRESINSCFYTDFSWDMCSANQACGYYDLYALRAEGWCEKDILREIQLRGVNKSPREMFDLRTKLIYDQMKVIPRNHSWISVDSAFGGLAIYQATIFEEFDYTSEGKHNEIQCEHVDLHLRMSNSGKLLYINPRLINSYWNTYNLNRIKIIRRIRGLKRRLG